MPPGIPFVKIQKNRKPGPGEKTCPECSGTGRVDSHVCKICHGAGAVPENWKPEHGTVVPGKKIPAGGNDNGNGNSGPSQQAGSGKGT